jgi:hypothetical protein
MLVFFLKEFGAKMRINEIMQDWFLSECRCALINNNKALFDFLSKIS